MKLIERFELVDVLTATVVDDKILAVTGAGLVDASTGAVLANIANAWIAVSTKQHVFVGAVNKVHIVDAATGAEVSRHGGLDGSDPSFLAVVPEGDGVLAVGGGEEGRLREFRVGKKSAVARAGGYRIACVAFQDDSRVVAPFR